MSCWWPWGNTSDYLKPEPVRYTYYDVPPMTSWSTTTTETTYGRVKPFYHPAAYSKRWKR